MSNSQDVIKNTIAPIVTYIVNPAMDLLIAAAVALFIWGVVELIMSGDEAEGRKKGQMHILFGIVGLFIIVAVWGIIRLVANTLGVDLPLY